MNVKKQNFFNFPLGNMKKQILLKSEISRIPLGNKIKNFAVLICALVLLTSFVYAETFLEEEAGMSAYVNVGQAIDLSKAEPAYRTIEYYTADYIVGSVELPDWSESEDVHVYVNSDGWIVAYYLKEEPVSKIMLWKGYEGIDINNTKLEDAISKMSVNIGISYPAIKGNTRYYNFRYPNATKLMIIEDRIDVDGTDTFNFMVPNEYILYEGSWSHYSYDSYSSYTYIDGHPINHLGSCDDCTQLDYGKYSAIRLETDEFHTIKVTHVETSSLTSNYTGYACIAAILVYKE